MTTRPKSGSGIPRELLAHLHCPYCGTRLETESADSGVAGVSYGILRCACHEYPVIEGIPVLQQLDGLQRVVELIRAADRRSALLRTLDMFRVQWAQRSKLHRLKYHWNCSRLVSQADMAFSDAAQLVRRPKVFADYLVHRYANPSFLASIGPILLLARSAKAVDGDGSQPPGNRPISVLDLGCGAGHASYLMRLLNPALSVVSADQDFVNVYLARRYLVPDGVHLCLDGQVPSPFPDRHFDAIYCQDAFHYFHSKKAAVGELKRIARPGALWMFPHLHNRLCVNLVPGIPLSPDGYLQCFDLPGARLFSESALLRGLWSNRAVDLSTLDSRLNESPNLTMIRGDSEMWQVHRDFPRAFCDRVSALEVNPIYSANPSRDGVLLERRWPNPVMQRECAEAETVLPKLCRIPAEQLAQLAASTAHPESSWIEDLVTRFVLVPLPQLYTRSSKSTQGIG